MSIFTLNADIALHKWSLFIFLIEAHFHVHLPQQHQQSLTSSLSESLGSKLLSDKRDASYKNNNLKDSILPRITDQFGWLGSCFSVFSDKGFLKFESFNLDS